jgi:hypothetical protein
MTISAQVKHKIPGLSPKNVDISFSGGEMTSDAGILLLQKADDSLKLLETVASKLEDNRRQNSCTHNLEDLLRQRVYGIAMGYEDLNDHDTLRDDLAFQTALGSEEALGSRSTLSRLENKANRKSAVDIHKILIDQFIASFQDPPKELILDFDATDDLIHGNQEKSFYHGYYGHNCFLPLYVTCDKKLLVSYLRESNIDGAKHAGAILALLTKRFRQEWPDVKIIFRADSGFCRWKIFRWCDRNDVSYITGIPKNSRISSSAEPLTYKVEEYYQHTCEKQRLFSETQYAAKSWDKERRIIIKAEHSENGGNFRCLVTNLKEDPQYLYETMYCARGEMENRIKEQQLGLFADRTSCHNFWPNQFRLLLSSLAYLLIEHIRSSTLKNTLFESAQVTTIRLKLLKIGGVIVRNTRRIRFFLSSAFPHQELFASVFQKLVPV